MPKRGQKRDLTRRLDGQQYRLHRPGVHYDVTCPLPDCNRRIDRTKLTQHINSKHRRQPPAVG